MSIVRVLCFVSNVDRRKEEDDLSSLHLQFCRTTNNINMWVLYKCAPEEGGLPTIIRLQQISLYQNVVLIAFYHITIVFVFLIIL